MNANVTSTIGDIIFMVDFIPVLFIIIFTVYVIMFIFFRIVYYVPGVIKEDKEHNRRQEYYTKEDFKR